MWAFLLITAPILVLRGRYRRLRSPWGQSQPLVSAVRAASVRLRAWVLLIAADR